MRLMVNCFTIILFLFIASAPTTASAESGTAPASRALPEMENAGLGDTALPDLAVSAVSGPFSPASGSTISFTDTTTNNGAIAVGASVTGFFLSADKYVTNEDTLLGQRDVPVLAAGESDTKTTSLTIPLLTPPGVYYIIARSDHLGEVQESSETNNDNKRMIRILPDLTVTSVKLSSSSSAESTISVAVIIKNIGVVSAGPSTAGLFLSSNSQLDASAVMLGELTTPSLALGQYITLTESVTIPAGTIRGSYYLIASSDILGAVTEVLEGNNSRVSPLSIINATPKADAGPDQIAAKGSLVSLDGTGSADPDSDVLTFNWMVVSKPEESIAALSSSSIATPTFTPDKDGIYVMALTVSDGSATSTVSNVTISTLNCATDDIGTVPASGSMIVSPTRDFVPLCNGWVLLGDRSFNTVRILNVLTGAEGAPVQLTAAPGDLELDFSRGLLYVTLSPATFVSKINLKKGTQSKISLSADALALTSGTDGALFAATGDSVAIIDGPTGAINKVVSGIQSSLLAFDKAGSQLITAQRGGSSLSRYLFSASALNLTKTQSIPDAGSNGKDLTISPDGNHIAFPCGGGNGAGYTIFDFASDDLDTIYGEWITGAYPNAAAFDSTGRYLVATNDETIQVFDVFTHIKIKEYAINMGDCGFGNPWRLGFSNGGKIVYGLANCGYANDHAKLFWDIFEP